MTKATDRACKIIESSKFANRHWTTNRKVKSGIAARLPGRELFAGASKLQFGIYQRKCRISNAGAENLLELSSQQSISNRCPCRKREPRKNPSKHVEAKHRPHNS